MQALRLVEWEHDAELRDVPVPEPGPGEVLVKMGGAGACQSDLHLMEWPAGFLPWTLPFTLGHENAGWVEQLGPGVSGFSIGDPVAVYGHWGCGRCHACRTGFENYCENSATHNDGAPGGGLGLNGGMADYMVVPHSRFLVPLTNLHPRDAAPLTDAGLTPYHAIKRSIGILGARSCAVVIGVGGLGHMAIQILRTLTVTRIIAVDASAEKFQLAREAGADETVLAGEDAKAQIRELTGGLGANVVLDFVGGEDTLRLGVGVSRMQGHHTIVGALNGLLPWKYFDVPYACPLTTTYWGSLPELMEVVALAEAGRIKSHTSFELLTNFEKVYATMRAGTLQGRVVFTPAVA